MSLDETETKRKELLARAAIETRYGTQDDELGGTLFVSHHIEEIKSDYWQSQLNKDVPTPQDVMSLLVLRSHWDDDRVFDFTLPEDITDYVISVSFNEQGEVKDITMES